MLTVVVMGVAGVGKTTVGRGLAQALGAQFLEGDSFHPASNVAKMSRGEPLDDADRRPWLTAIAAEIDGLAGADEHVVVACSALKRAYRELLRAGRPIVFVHLSGAAELIARRLAARRDHYMPPSLLASQLATLEPPDADELAVTVDVTESPQQIVNMVLAELEHFVERRPPPRPRSG